MRYTKNVVKCSQKSSITRNKKFATIIARAIFTKAGKSLVIVKKKRI